MGFLMLEGLFMLVFWVWFVVFCLVVVGGCLAQLLLEFCVLGSGVRLGVFGGSV
jgi:hypothetical protein